jgi:hypothetical protein
MYFLQVPLELLYPRKLFVAPHTPSLRYLPRLHLGACALGARASTFAAVRGSFNNCILSSSAGLCLGYVSMHSNHGKPGCACLVVWRVRLWYVLDANGQGDKRCCSVIVGVQRKRSFIATIQCRPSTIVPNGHVKRRATRRVTERLLIDTWAGA